MTEKVLLLENYRQSAPVVRSLSRAGYEIILGRSGPKPYMQFSRYVSEVWQHPPLLEKEQFVKALSSILKERPDVTHVFPLGDLSSSIISCRLSEFSKNVCFIVPSKESVETCVNKREMSEIASSLNIPAPESRVARTQHEVRSAANALGYPCIIKNINSFNSLSGKKAVICASSADVEKLLSSLDMNEKELIVQRYVSGLRHNCEVVAAFGKTLAYYEMKIVRTDRLDGTGYAVETESLPPSELLRKYCESLVKKLEYSGIGCIQFIVSIDKISFLEFNPRIDALCDLPYRGGFDCPLLALSCAELAQGKRSDIQGLPGSYKVNQKYHWLEGDLRALPVAILSREVTIREGIRWILTALRAFLRADVHQGFDFRDPLPTVWLYLVLVKGVLRKSIGIR